MTLKIYANIQIFRIIALILIIVTGFLPASAGESYFVRGIVRDSISNEPIPYASVVTQETGRGGVADESGIFEITIPVETKALQISCVGYDKYILPIKRNRLNTYAVYLQPSTTQLQEVVVRKGKYSKKNNPAVDFMRMLKERAPLTDPLRNDFYSYDKYERITMGMNDFKPEEKNALIRKFPFLVNHVDTSEVSGKPYLSLIVKEKLSEINHRREPEAYREIITAQRADGVDEIIDPTSMRALFEDVLREIDLYQNDITLLQNKFVSPLSRIAADFYKFYLTDTVSIDDERCIVLSFYPHNHAAFGFMGHVYVPEGDSTMFIRRVEMHTPRDINLNFIDNLYITQNYERAPDGSRLKTADILTIELSIVGKHTGMYLQRTTNYANHSFNEIADSTFHGDGNVVEVEGASTRDEQFWDNARLSEISYGERNVGTLMEHLRQVPLYYWGEKALKILFSGYIMTGNPSKFDIGPVNSMLSFNQTEDVRFRFGGMTTAALSPRWFARAYGAYGLKDHRWKYKAELEYTFLDKEQHAYEFPMQSIRLTSMYDIDRPGQNYLFTSADNIVLSLRRASDDRSLYRRLNKLEFTYENRWNFTIGVALSNIWREAAPSMPFIDGHGNHIKNFTENTVELLLRYAPGEKFMQTRSYRFPINLDAPAITLRHIFAPKGVFGTKYAVNTTEIDIQKRWWFSAFGYLDMYIGGGHVWSSSSFLDLLIPNANLSYIIQPRSFALMNPMEFINSSYASIDLTYWANGALFNYIPYLKKLKLREVFCFRGIWGNLSDRNNPALHPELLQFPAGTGMVKMDKGPYMEASVGIENIFKVLRIDYVWRLNYLDVPYAIDRHGLRLAIHVTF